MARREKIVVDASVAYKWYIEEDWSDEARRIIQDYASGTVDLASPVLMPFEVLNALRYAPEFGLVDLIKVTQSMEKLCLDLRLMKGDLSKRTLENALKYGLTVYDSSYISLGELEDAPVYTADDKLLRRADDAGVHHISRYLT